MYHIQIMTIFLYSCNISCHSLSFSHVALDMTLNNMLIKYNEHCTMKYKIMAVSISSWTEKGLMRPTSGWETTGCCRKVESVFFREELLDRLPTPKWSVLNISIWSFHRSLYCLPISLSIYLSIFHNQLSIWTWRKDVGTWNEIKEGREG